MYSRSATWWGAPGVLGVVGGIYGLATGAAGAGVIALAVGLSLLWSAYRRYQRDGRI